MRNWILLLLVSIPARAGVPTQLSVQGVLRDQQGQLQSMPVNVTVNLFSKQSGGTPILAAPVGPTTVTATNGLFTMPINLSTAEVSSLASAAEAWLEITIDNEAFPRQRLTAEPYALVCRQAESLNCSGCINDSMIGSIAAGKIMGDVATASSATGLRGAPISETPPLANQVLRFDGTNWVPTNVVSTVTAGSGLSGGDITNSGTLSLASTIPGERTFTDGLKTSTLSADGVTAGKLEVVDGNGVVRGGLYDGKGQLTVAGTNGVGFFADGSFQASPSPSPQMYLDRNGALNLTHALQPGTISSSGTTVTGVGTQFSPSWVGKFLVWASADGLRDGPSQNIYGKITAVASATSLTVDREMNKTGVAIPAGERFYISTPFTPTDMQVGDVRVGNFVGGGNAPLAGICAGGIRTGLATCMVNLAYTWAWTAGISTIATLDSGGNFTINGNAVKPGGGSWATPSDARLKDVAGRFTRGLEAILALEPIRYRYKAKNALGLPSVEEHIGFLAQSVQKAIPEAVIQRADGYLTVNNDPIMWSMVNALKEEHRRNQELQARLDRLEGRVTELLKPATNERHARR